MPLRKRYSYRDLKLITLTLNKFIEAGDKNSPLNLTVKQIKLLKSKSFHVQYNTDLNKFYIILNHLH